MNRRFWPLAIGILIGTGVIAFVITPADPLSFQLCWVVLASIGIVLLLMYRKYVERAQFSVKQLMLFMTACALVFGIIGVILQVTR